MSWFYLTLAGLFEVGWAFGLKQSEGFTKPLPTALTLILMAASIGLLALSLKQLPLGTAYAVWTGIGAIGTVAVGIAFLGESRDWPRIVCLGLILAGIVGLKLLSKSNA
jgi:quaternary ammonium compound-resistance protein SugE